MKNLHKKICAIVLVEMIVLGTIISQGFVAHANYDLLDKYLLKNPYSMPIEDYFNYMCLQNNQFQYKYDALYLGNSSDFIHKVQKSSKYKFIIPKRGIYNHYYLEYSNKYYFLEFEDEWSFLKSIQKKELDKYRHRKDPIIVKVGNCYFNIFFQLTYHQREVIPVKELAKEYGFSIEYANDNGFYGKYVIQSHLENRFDLNGKQQIVNDLIKEPNQNGVNLFNDVESFAYALQYGHNIPQGFSRYRIGYYDFIIKK